MPNLGNLFWSIALCLLLQGAPALARQNIAQRAKAFQERAARFTGKLEVDTRSTASYRFHNEKSAGGNIVTQPTDDQS